MNRTQLLTRGVVCVGVCLTVALAAAALGQRAAPQMKAQEKAMPMAPCRVTSAVLRTAAAPYGPCPVVVRFSGGVTVAGAMSENRPCQVRYIFTRSDGATDTIEKTLTFTTPGTTPVSTTWTLGGPSLTEYVGWEALKILSPNPLESHHADFKMRCEAKKPEARIVSVECAGGLAVRVHVLIDSPAGVSSFRVWSTWAGGDPYDKSYAPPLPTHVDEVVTIAHSVPDPVDRMHQWGLKVNVPGLAEPLSAYGFEPGPGSRCPGHYRPSPTPAR